MLSQCFGQTPHIPLGAQDVVAGFVVAGFGHRRQRKHSHVLHRLDHARATLYLGFEPGVLVAQHILRMLEFQVCAYPRQHNRGTDRLGNVVHRTEC